MAGNRLSGRLEALEQAVDPHLSAPVLVVVDPAASEDQARARWQEANGSLDARRNVLLVGTGVPRSAGGVYG
ncbi:hypothetical protein [Novosphingobium sp.]|uniref:hypothetical protein n=1 Tax=Novosphingobium sp. TaxID=1874826 RepID=UPI002639E045|nr:hypothetical protein [Novosphingobium sp.]